MGNNLASNLLMQMKGLTIFILCLFLVLSAEAHTVKVCASCFNKGLQQSIDKAGANDTLILQKGAYDAVNVTINKPLTILGEDYPVLDAKNKDEVLSILADHVNIIGLEIRNTNQGSMKDYAGIRIFQAHYVSILNCHLNNTYFGIYVSDASHILVKGNHLSGLNYGKSNTGNGIHIWKSDSVNVVDNYSEGHRDGIYLEFAKHCLIKNNRSEHNFRYGLHFMFSDDDVYVNNIFRNNGTGVAVMYTKRVQMLNNKFLDNWGDASYGLLLKDMTGGLISGNTFQNNTIAITMEGSDKMHFEKNDFLKNGYAIKIMANCMQDTFIMNNFSGNTFDAATNGQLVENVFTHNYWDKYEGYDLNRDKIGDIPYCPVSLYSVIVEQMPYAVMLLRSFTVDLLNRAEKNIPSIVPETFEDRSPMMALIKR